MRLTRQRAALRRGERTAGRADLGQGDGDEDREEEAEPDRSLVGKIIDRLIWWNHGCVSMHFPKQNENVYASA